MVKQAYLRLFFETGKFATYPLTEKQIKEVKNFKFGDDGWYLECKDVFAKLNPKHIDYFEITESEKVEK